MRSWACFVILFALVSGAPAAVKHKAAAAGKPGVKRSVARKPNRTAKKTVGRRASSSSRKLSRRRTIAASKPVRQAVPSSDRYKEIQEALAQKGYLTTPPTGVWDQNAQDAMRKFQADQNLSVSGKLSSRSIIALGLGSPTAAVPAATSTAVPPKP